MYDMPYIKVYKDFLAIAEALDNGQRGRLFLAILQYVNGLEPEPLTGAEYIAFLTMKGQVDRDQSGYSSRAAEASRENGRKGGRPRKQASDSDDEEPEKPKKTYGETQKPETKPKTLTKTKTKTNNEDEEEDEEEKKPAIAGKEKTTAVAVSARAGEDRQARQAEKAEEERLFDAFWIAYPRKQGKQDALKAFHALKPDAKTVGVMLQAIQQQKTSQQWRESERFIPLPATWIRGKRWEDERIRDGGHQHFDAEREYTPASVTDMPDWLREELGQEAQPAAGSDMPDWVMDRWHDMQERGEV